MDRLTAMRVFVEIVDSGSITLAAERLSLSRAMVSRYLADLEGWLQLRLLHRTTRRLSLTEAGTEALQHCRSMLALEAQVQGVAGALRQTPQGRLRLTTSASLADAYLTEAMARFLQHYPGIHIELLVLERAVNLVEERVDLALRITNQLDEQQHARLLGRCHSVLCASPDYLARHVPLEMPQQLQQHQCITHAYVGRSEYLLHRGQDSVRVPVGGRLHSNETLITRRAALAGAGIAQLPMYLVQTDLQQGRLQAVLPEWSPATLGVYALYLNRQHQPLSLRLLLDFLAADMEGRVL